MRRNLKIRLNKSIFFIYFPLLLILGGCNQGGSIQPLNGLNGMLLTSSNSRKEPDLERNWLVTLSNSNGKEKIELINLRTRKAIPIPGVNRPDAQPLSVSISANGERMAIIRQRANQIELLLYRRRLGTLQQLELKRKGIPRKVSLDGKGRVLAVQVSRDGLWETDLFRLSN